MIPEQAEGNPRIMDQREMKNTFDYRARFSHGKGAGYAGLTELVKPHDRKAGQPGEKG